MVVRGGQSTSNTSLDTLGILELLNQDLRPTFIIDLQHGENDETLNPTFCNPVLDISRRLKEVVIGKHIHYDGSSAAEQERKSYNLFRDWARIPKMRMAQDVFSRSYLYGDMQWKASTLGSRWRVICGSKRLPCIETTIAHATNFLGYENEEMPDYFISKGFCLKGLVKLRTSLFGDQDLAVQSPRPDCSEFGKWFYNFDWASSSLGHMQDWSEDLLGISKMVMADCNPAVIFWGSDDVMVYNEAYRPLLGKKHPAAMGAVPAIVLSEVWPQVSAMLDDCRQFCKTVSIENMIFWLNRYGYKEETYFSSTFVPLVSTEGTVAGFYESVTEVTATVIGSRRQQILDAVTNLKDTCQSAEDFWLAVTKVLQNSPEDLPYFSIFSVEDCSAAERQDTVPQRLKPWAGGSETFSESPALTEEDRIFLLDAFRETGSSGRSRILPSPSPNSSNRYIMDNEALRPTGCLRPINLTSQFGCSNFLYFSTSPWKTFDDKYQLFAERFADLVAEIVMILSCRRKSHIDAQAIIRQNAVEQARLEEELRLKTLEVQQEETRFTRLANLAPVGIFIGKADGTFTFRNRMWYDVAQPIAQDSNSPFVWMDIVHPNAKDQLGKLWAQICTSKTPVSAEIQLARSWTPPRPDALGKPHSIEPSSAWVLLMTQAEQFNPDGTIKSFIGVLTDISHQKWAEGEQSRRKEDALESKRQQEAFVDMVSHEIRNPLGAILISADGIEESLVGIQSSDPAIQEAKQSNLDATRVIIHCVQYQKRIVDDILSMSKMDSNLLTITPVSEDPATVVRDAVNMLSSEAKSGDITMHILIEQSYHDLAISQVLLDPSRLTQVLINLLTNAIKFTKTRPTRKITVSIGASRERPRNASHGVKYIPTKSYFGSSLQSAEWGTGDKVYLHFAIRDTGRGLSDGEKKVLFQRFSQASPRTHVNYGGSGLGLFISRALVEKQGGEIGVASNEGEGSNFSFYIMTRLVTSAFRKDSLVEQSDVEATDTPVHKRPKTTTRSRGGKVTTTRSYVGTRKSSVDGIKKAYSVLVVEDNLVNQTVVSKQLKQRGCIVHVANHGQEALEFLQTTKFWHGNERSGVELDVVLMDQEMPVMDGLTCIKRIRELEGTGDVVKRLPVIAVTANARQEQVDILMAAGMDDVLLKPFRIPGLMEKLEDLCSKS